MDKLLNGKAAEVGWIEVTLIDALTAYRSSKKCPPFLCPRLVSLWRACGRQYAILVSIMMELMSLCANTYVTPARTLASHKDFESCPRVELSVTRTDT